MRDLNYELKQLCYRNRDGSFATQSDRGRILDLIANQLHELGYKDMRATSLKPKHVEALAQRWQTESLSPGTMKNRMSVVRWWSEKIGKQNVVARDNDQYGIPDRQHITNMSKARELTGTNLDKVTDPYTAMSLRLQAAFGLRRAAEVVRISGKDVVRIYRTGKYILKLILVSESTSFSTISRSASPRRIAT